MKALRVPAATRAASANEPATLEPFEVDSNPPPSSQLDRLVFGRLQRLGIIPARPCSDAVFLRRAYLDVIGTLPTGSEAREFLLDTNPAKRPELIERLLQRDEFADYWAMKWCDLLRVKSEFPINLWPNAVQAYHRWILVSIRDNKRYDRFAREMLTASGSCFRIPEVNFYRALQSKTPEGIAQTVALTFMGTRTEKWPKTRLEGMAAFFAQISYKATSEWKEEIVLHDPQASSTAARTAIFPDDTPASITAGQDPRTVFADWLIDPKNPWFARNIVNRIWCWLLGRGIIHEADDIRPDNPPTHPNVLALLERQLVGAHYDLKHIYRLVLNSRTYQLSSIPRSQKPEARTHFASYPVRRVEAEVLIDAICQITGTTEKYSSAVPEPFTVIPDGERSIRLSDASITSPFLEMFGRSSRDTGLEAERNNRPTADQRLHLLNSTHIERKLSPARPASGSDARKKRPRDLIEQVYLSVLSRFPTSDELASIEGYAQRENSNGKETLIDLTWALINSAEFLYRH